MNLVFNAQALKKPTNVSINNELLLKAKQFKINLSATLEAALVDAVKPKQRELWKQENQAAIKAYNQMIESHGLFSDDLRSF
ncbi:MAG: type II toxin-antitoxin system CcdA family antitoxin [Methylobacter sp.]|nr:type II toxin-antitoxin system CcdA family antitoxin [Methylobacter sp.]MDP2097794.1 type II toxin-antitoxin system CcdA family antitoxin [Methylobacter sp.]MDP3056117.1 type II toxin-antitoxin system CcdA family antitoxin [Methylobacter sp.]